MVVAIDKNNVQSFASEPILMADEKHISTYQAEQFATKSDSAFKEFSGAGFVEISTTLNRKLSFNINVEEMVCIALIFVMPMATGQPIQKTNVL